jgi:hypothetical protein
MKGSVGMLGFAGVAVLAIYLAAVLQGYGSVEATEQLTWFVGAGILGVTVGLLLFDP